MNWIADDLRRRGYAVWNIDYRGVDRTGGGYPGTFLDATAAADALETYADQFQLDLDRLVAVGHSAGGHLALWLAGRPRLPAGSPLRAPNP
jgi:acetyl esterase/lipase